MKGKEINENSYTNNSEKINMIKSNNTKSSDNNLKNSDSSAGDLISKINKEANTLDQEINSSNLKVFEKYHNLSIKELQILLSQKNDNILNLNDQKEKYKKRLNEIIKKLNSTISKNSDFLYDENGDPDLIINLENIIEEKKRDLENSKKINKFYKSKLDSIKDRVSLADIDNKKVNSIEIQINNLKKKNSLIKKEINDIRIDKLKHKKEYELVTDNKKFWHKIKIKTEEMNNFSAQKQGYFTKLNMSMKSLDNVIKEVKRFEEIYNASINEEIEESLVKKINFWMNLIKQDLSGDKNEILYRIENDKSLFLKKINNKNELMERYSTNPTLNNNMNTNFTNLMENANLNIQKNNENNLIKNRERDKEINDITENNTNINNSILNNNVESIETQSRLFKNRIIINKNKSSSLILSTFNKGSNSVKRGNQHINFFNKNNNINASGNFNYNLEYKTLFRKLNYLKLKSPLGSSMKIKLNNIDNLDSYNKGNNLISEEINDTLENNLNIKSNQNTSENNNELILDNILTKDYNEITNGDYRELLNKKDQYLQQNLRLEKNIEDIQRTKNKKLSNVLKIIEENIDNLENLKNRNNILKKEIQNLSNVKTLRLEQVKLESELLPKRPNIKKLKITSEQNKSEEINKLIEINYYYKKKLKERKNNKIDYFDEVFKKNKNTKNNKSNSKKKENSNENTNREEKLKIIKEKYKKGDYDDSGDIDLNEKNKKMVKIKEEYKDDKDKENKSIDDKSENKENNNYTQEEKEKIKEISEKVKLQN
jgi:hypothetical protein